MKYTIIVPTYNEIENIERCIREISRVLDSSKFTQNFNILITDAKSPDGTGKKIEELSKSIPNLYLINETTKQGLGKAYIDAMDYAFSKLESDGIVTFDADLSHDVNLLPKLLEELENGGKFAIGSRYIKGGGIPDNWGLHRKLLSRFGNYLVKVLYLSSGISDFTSGYKAISRELFYKIKDKLEKHTGYTFAISTNLESIRLGYKPKEFAYKFIDRTAGESKMGPEYIINGLKYVMMSRLKDIMNNRFAKVFMSGGVGSVFQLGTYGLLFFPLFEGANILDLPSTYNIGGLTIFPRFLISQLFAIEMGIISTFLVNNYWSFRDNRLHGIKLLRGLLKNHLVVIGAIIIQLTLGQILKSIFGPGLIRQYTYQIVGILTGLFWNFFFYKKIIWKVAK